MPNSLKCRLKKLAYQGLLSEKDLSRIYTDNDVVAELEKIKAEIRKLTDINPDYPMDRTIHISRNEVLEIIDKHINKNSCDTCTHKGYDCDNDFWIDCEQYDGENKEK